jgi:LmbE family N-acetylglucosaminyl deacetylase
MIHIISPHIDDAVLSMGGLMQNFIKNGHEVKVQYIFTLSNWTNAEALSGIKYEQDVALVTRIRKEEEYEVGALLGHQYEFHDFEDLPIRTIPPVGQSGHLMQLICERISASVAKHDMCFFPVCTAHPDHEVIRDIGFDLLARGFNIYFYEDMPYMAHSTSAPSGFHRNMHRDGFVPEYVSINIEDKISLLKLYKSQVSEEWLNRVMSYSYNLIDNSFYERVWTLKATTHRKNFKTSSYVPVAMGQ